MEKRDKPIPSCSRARLRSAILISVLIVLLGSLSCGREKGTGPKDDANSLPVITSIKILPENPSVKNDLNPVIRSEDPDGDSITYHYQWMKDEKEISGENRTTLTSGKFKKGDLISIKVAPSDGKAGGVPVLSAPVKILNSLPVVEEVSIEPRVAYAVSNLKAGVKGSDPDGDFIYYTYRWEKNGTTLSEERGDVLEKGRFRKGDSITVTVTPDDREVLGLPRRSVPIIISNSPPVIISSPSTSTEGKIYTYQVKANDPDGDRVTFVLKFGPPGMEINRDTGLIRWEIRKEGQGSHSVEVEASDDEGARSTQRFTVNVEFN